MILKRLVLHNYRQHRDLDIPLEGTLIAVIGPNGSGKSNLLGSIQFALTGEQSGFNKDDLLAWDSGEGSVTLYFEHDNTEGVICRNVHNSGCTMKFGDHVYNTASKTAEAIKIHLALDKGLADQAVFVRQKMMDAILFEDPRVRELAFQKLMGIGDAAKIYDVLGKVLSGLEDPPNYDEQISDGKARWAEMHERISGLKLQMQQLQQQRQQAPDVVAIRQSIESRRQLIQRAQRMAWLAESRQKTEDTRQYEIGGWESASQHMTVSLPEIDARLGVIRKQVMMADTYKRALTAWESAGTAVLNLGQPPYPQSEIEAAKADYEMMTGTINQQLGQHKLYANMLKALDTAGYLEECPVCGAPVTNENTLKRRLRDIVAGIEKVGQELREEQLQRKQKFDAKLNAMVTFDSKYRTAVGAYTQADNVLKATPKYEADTAALTAEIAELERRRSNYVDAAATQTSCMARIKEAEAAIAKIDAEVAAIRQVWPEATTADAEHMRKQAEAEIPQLEQQRDTLSQLDAELARLQGAVNELQATMDSLDKTVATLEFKRASHQTLRDALSTLSRVRDWFHYKNGPHTLSAGVLQTMNQEVNRFLSNFAAPFTVEPAGDTLGFLCYFTDGRPMPKTAPDATILSGGEKIQLAVAFRFAAYCMFASKLGLLSLDEPTVYLDDENVGRFGDLLQQVKQIAQGMNLQVLIATHERSVIPFCDTVIDLGDRNTPTVNV